MKRCSACGVEKAPPQFKRDQTHADGLASQCKACGSTAARERHRRNPEPARTRARAWQAAHVEQASAKSLRWAHAHPERRKAIANKSAAKHYRADIGASRAKGRAAVTIRRCRQRANRIGPVDYIKVMLRDRMRCHLCKRGVMRSELHFDHVIPLAKGGAHAEENIAVSHATCNLRKNAKVLTLF